MSDEKDPNDHSNSDPELDIDADSDASLKETESQSLQEDEPSQLDQHARALDESEPTPDHVAEGTARSTHVVGEAESEDAGDTDSISDDVPAETAVAGESIVPDWDQETSAYTIAVELKRVEKRIRSMLEHSDSRRKRRLAGTRRWHDLHEDVISWYFTSRVDEASLAEFRRLVAKRHSLFQRLNFMAGTRPGWNS